MFWSGKKKIAFIPVSRPFIDTPPVDWVQQIERRIYFDPNSSRDDMSLRTHIHTTSYGRADLEGQILPMVEINRQNVEVDALADEFEDSLRSQGFHAAAIVMLGGAGAGSAQPSGFWARFVMAEAVGVWAMEFTHVITGYGDLRTFGELSRDIGSFDNMAYGDGTHPTAYTKRALGWLDQSSIRHHIGRSAAYDLHDLGLVQPPPAGRTAAVQVGQNVPILMAEARQKVDQFDAGIKNEGVIVYETVSLDADGGSSVLRPLIELRTPAALTPGQSFTSATGVTVRVIGAIAGGFSIRVEDSSQHVVDRTGEFKAPAASSPPTVCVVPGLGAYNLAYRDASGHLHELWRDSQGTTGTTDLTANAGAPTAAGNPFAYADLRRDSEILLFRDSDGTVRSLHWSTGAVGHDNLSGTAHSPEATGDPVGYYTPGDDTHHVIYRSGDGHLHELWWAGVAPVAHGGDLTSLAAAPKAAGEPAAYSDPVRGQNLVIFRGTDGHIRSLFWETGAVQHEDLSGFAGTPAAASDPVAYYTTHDDVHQVTYRSADGHLHELFWQGITPVTGWDLTEHSGAPKAAGKPAAFYDPGTNTKHVVFRSADNRLHEIRWVPAGGQPEHVDLTDRFGAPPAADWPVAYTVDWLGTQHIAYRGTDGHIYELIR